MEALLLMEYVGTKDIARELGTSVRTIKRWWQKLRMKPTIPAHACHRWSVEDKAKLISAIAGRARKATNGTTQTINRK
jgi:hypothetical protein